MDSGTTILAGITIPSTDPVFLSVVAIHVLVGLTAAVSGAVAMLSRKRAGRHPTLGTLYFWCLAAVFVTATVLSSMRWAENHYLFILGTLAFLAALLGRTARRRRWSRWARWHIISMGFSYILLLTAFYVDNGRNLPLWRDLPVVAYWLLPSVVGIPIIIRALIRNPLARRAQTLR
jgi:uncharacterized membrane protein